MTSVSVSGGELQARAPHCSRCPSLVCLETRFPHFCSFSLVMLLLKMSTKRVQKCWLAFPSTRGLGVAHGEHVC